MFWRPPTDEQIAAWRGTKTIEDFPEPVAEVWDENFDQVIWFRSMLSQFNNNGYGATGFNYAVAYRDFDDMGLSGDRLDEWKWKLKVMESAALTHINKPTA